MTTENNYPRNLLLVDDEPNILSALKRTLRKNGYTIFTAASGIEGLDLLANQDIGVIISDQRMPQMTGVDFLRKVKMLHPKTVRIVLSGYAEIETVTSAINEGAIYKFLSKPWDDEQLRVLTDEAFQRYEIKQENQRLSLQLQEVNQELNRLNKNLEQQVADKTREITKNITMLEISQEILEHLPVAIIGIDDQHMIAISNRCADALFRRYPSESLLGLPAQCLPVTLLNLIKNLRLNDTFSFVNGSLHVIEGQNMHVWIDVMGVHSRSKGTIIVLSPNLAY